MERGGQRSLSNLDAPWLWVIAVLFFGLGDVATTGAGLGVGGVIERHPLAAARSGHAALASIIALKGVVFGICYALWRVTPRPHRVGVPLGLTVVGVPVTVWNLHVLLLAGLS